MNSGENRETSPGGSDRWSNPSFDSLGAHGPMAVEWHQSTRKANLDGWRNRLRAQATEA
jgi:hypothetical protein